MPGIEQFIQRKNEFKESYEGLKNEPNLISFDGPDGVGKSEILNRVILQFKQKFSSESKNPEDVVYLKYTSLMDTESQKNITQEIKKIINNENTWDVEKIDNILNLWSAKINRSYNDHIIPLIKESKIVFLDRSETDLFRAGLEWADKEMIDKITKNMKNGTLTHGITAGNRVFISSSPEDSYKRLISREDLSPNDPRSLEEMKNRIEKENEAEELISNINEKEKPNIIKIHNDYIEDSKERNIKLDKLAEEIIGKLKL